MHFRLRWLAEHGDTPTNDALSSGNHVGRVWHGPCTSLMENPHAAHHVRAVCRSPSFGKAPVDADQRNAQLRFFGDRRGAARGPGLWELKRSASREHRAIRLTHIKRWWVRVTRGVVRSHQRLGRRRLFPPLNERG